MAVGAGAAVLAGRGALYAGAGRVFVVTVDPGPGFDQLQPELMFRASNAFKFEAQTLVLGPGMGDSVESMRALGHGIDGTAPLVIDADGLNLLAASTDLQARLVRRQGDTIVTPHPLEAARLLGIGAAEVQADRMKAARDLARRFNAVAVLKGSGTVIAAQEGCMALNPTGNPGLAKGGTGDVLAGAIGAMLAAGLDPFEAAAAGVWLHAEAARRCGAAFIADDLADALSAVRG